VSAPAALEARPADVAEASRYGMAHEAGGFAARQLRARVRLRRLVDFYAEAPCRMSPIHLLTAHAIVLGRFCGVSGTFDAIGEALMPDPEGSPEWAAYREASRTGRPVEMRDELWIAAHVADMQRVRAAGLDAAFATEAAQHAGEPIWMLLRQHMDATVGAHLVDRSAIAGAIAYETAIAQSISVGLRRLLRGGWLLLGRYAKEALRAIFTASAELRPGLLTYRRSAFALLGHAIASWRAAGVYRRGLRQRDRGHDGKGDSWLMIEEVLGARAAEVHPLIRDFYANPARFSVKAELELHTIPARLWSRCATLLLGQGLYEADHGEMDARFRVFRRADGSMHFVRELYCGGVLRTFDSDFVVRGGKLYEVFIDLGVSVEMDLRPLGGGGLSIRGAHIYRRGLRLPPAWLKVEFRSRVEPRDGIDEVRIDGHLLMQPDGPVGRFLAHKLLRRPEQLGCIHYRGQRS
jgi:hypothetical protein